MPAAVFSSKRLPAEIVIDLGDVILIGDGVL